MPKGIERGRAPQIIVLGGPNGAGKSTAARGVLGELLKLGEFVNADTIASGLAGFAPERTAFAAGRIMLDRLHELARAGQDFAFETTMASRTFVPWLRDLRKHGYEVNVVFMWLRTPELAIRRVKRRVREGGHNVPMDVVRRRYRRGIVNFLENYLPLADQWRVYDNSATGLPRLVARGGHRASTVVSHPATWRRIMKERGNGGEEHV